MIVIQKRILKGFYLIGIIDKSMMGYKDNVSIEDIKSIEVELNITLTNEGREFVLKEYDRIVWDSYKDWDVLLRELVKDKRQYE